MYFDRTGVATTLRQWATWREDRSYRELARDEAVDGEVISVWLGLEQCDREDDGRPFIFGTIHRRSDGSFDGASERFARDEAEALTNHRELLARLSR
jgi:hypothetical protein